MVATMALEAGDQCQVYECWITPTHQCLDCEHEGRESLFCQDCWDNHECLHRVNWLDETKPRCSTGVFLPTGCDGPYDKRRKLVDLTGAPVEWTPCMAQTGDFGPRARLCYDTADVRILVKAPGGQDFCRRCAMDPQTRAIYCHCLS